MNRLAIVGPTATGKTALALEIARRLGGVELVSVDAIAVYRGFDIGTAKPTGEERSRVPWHLIDIASPREWFSVALFQVAAHRALATIAARGKVPILVGGTGLYHRAVIDDLEIPPSFPEIRNELEARADALGLATLYAELLSRDPLAARRTEPTNLRRIVRALEVLVGTGRPFSSFGPGLTSYRPSPWTIVGLRIDRRELDDALDRRLDAQFRRGFLEEAAGLLARPGGLSGSARSAIGYRELFEHLGGRMGFAATRREILARSRAFARRQEAWFRRDPRVTWVDANDADLVATTIEIASTDPI
jgi:tRNA dimethylallyltransferase